MRPSAFASANALRVASLQSVLVEVPSNRDAVRAFVRPDGRRPSCATCAPSSARTELPSLVILPGVARRSPPGTCVRACPYSVSPYWSSGEPNTALRPPGGHVVPLRSTCAPTRTTGWGAPPTSASRSRRSTPSCARPRRVYPPGRSRRRERVPADALVREEVKRGLVPHPRDRARRHLRLPRLHERLARLGRAEVEDARVEVDVRAPVDVLLIRGDVDAVRVTNASATAYVPRRKYARGSLSHTTSASVRIGATPISRRSWMNFVFTVPIFLKLALPALMNASPRFLRTELPLRSIVGTLRLSQNARISSSRAPTKRGLRPRRSALSSHVTTKSSASRTSRRLLPGPDVRELGRDRVGRASSSASITSLLTAAVFSFHMSRIHPVLRLRGSTSCTFTTSG